MNQFLLTCDWSVATNPDLSLVETIDRNGNFGILYRSVKKEMDRVFQKMFVCYLWINIPFLGHHVGTEAFMIIIIIF